MGVGLGEGVALAASLVMGGCFGIHWPQDTNPCADATQKVNECVSTTTPQQPIPPSSCAGAILCTSECINAASCADLQAIVSVMNPDPNAPVLQCITRCSSNQPR
jgi:hypothetical protein